MSARTLLCIETATSVGSVALVAEKGCLSSRSWNFREAHTERLFSTIESLLADCGEKMEALEGLAVSAGPGSFTGLRVGVSAAKALAWALKKPLYAACSLEALAFGARDRGLPVCAAFDAHAGEIYAACYRWSSPGSPAETLLAPSALTVDRLRGLLAGLPGREKLICLGEGFRAFESQIQARLGIPLETLPSSFDLPDAALLGAMVRENPEAFRVVDLPGFEPLYVRTSHDQLRLKK